MQNPPPGPPPGGQPPAAAAGMDKKTGAILSYALFWLSGFVMLFVGGEDPDVKYHAAQSTIVFGSLTVAYWLLFFVSAFLRGTFLVAGLFALVEFVIVLVTLAVWIYCLVRTIGGTGERFELPYVGSYVTPYAEQLAGAV